MPIMPLDSWLEAHNIHGTALIKVILCVDTVESLLEARVDELAKTFTSVSDGPGRPFRGGAGPRRGRFLDARRGGAGGLAPSEKGPKPPVGAGLRGRQLGA